MAEKNLWERVFDGELIEFMRFVGCDEKYINGKASDYECFAEVCRVFSLFCGSDVSRRFVKNINSALGGDVREMDIILQNAPMLWQSYNENKRLRLRSSQSTITTEQGVCSKLFVSDEKSKNIFMLNEIVDYVIKTDISSLCDLVRCVENKLKLQDNSSVISVSFAMKNDMFVRPDRYHAQMVIDSKKCDEFCNNEQNDILLCQVVCELLCSDKSRAYELHISGNSRAVGDFALYLSQHNMGARIYAMCELDMPCGEVVELCRHSTDKCRITPEFIVPNNANKERFEDYFKKLAFLYPIGAVTVR